MTLCWQPGCVVSDKHTWLQRGNGKIHVHSALPWPACPVCRPRGCWDSAVWPVIQKCAHTRPRLLLLQVNPPSSRRWTGLWIEGWNKRGHKETILGSFVFLYISTYFLKGKAHVYSNAWIHVPNKHRCCTHIQNKNRDDLSRVVKYSRSCAHSFISELPLTYVATCSSHTSALIKSLRQIGSLFPASQIQTNKKSDKLSLLYFRAH